MRFTVVATALVAGWAAASLGQPIGGAFQVNEYTSGVQSAPAVAAVPDSDRFVVLWESAEQDGDDLGIFGRTVDAGGAGEGPELPLNGFTSGPQTAPDVCAAADGSFVGVWQAEGSDESDIFARRFAGDGTSQHDEAQVNAPLPGSFEGAAAVAHTGSGFVVVWDDYEDVFARRFDASGAALGDAFQVNTHSLGFQGSADVAATADGGFVIAWEDGYFDADGEDGSGYGVFARRYDAGGSAAGAPFPVNSTTAGDQYAVSLTAPPDGGFIAVWQSLDFADPPADPAVFGQRYDAGGVPMGTEFRVSAPQATAADDPAVAADGHGNFVVVWNGPPEPGASTTILERRFRGAGTPIAGPTPVSVLPTAGPDPAPLQINPAVAAEPAGRYLVVWQRENGDGSEDAIIAQRFAAIDLTPSATPSATATHTATRTVTATVTATATESATRTPTVSPSPSRTATGTPSATLAPTTTATRTRTLTATVSATATSTPTRSASATRTTASTATATASASGSATPTASRTSTRTATASASPTATTTDVPTVTTTPTPSATSTATASTSPTATTTDAPTVTASPSPTATSIATASASPTATATALPSSTRTASSSPTSSSTPTATDTAAATPTDTTAPTASVTATASPSATLAMTPSAIATVTPTASPAASLTATQTSPSPTATTATETAAVPTSTPPATETATPSAPSCAGDCDGDRRVAINELIAAVGIALDDAAPTACRAADVAGDGHVTIDDLIRAVGSALTGCEAAAGGAHQV